MDSKNQNKTPENQAENAIWPFFIFKSLYFSEQIRTNWGT